MSVRRTVFTGAMLVADSLGRVVLCSDQLARWLNISPADLTGREAADLWAVEPENSGFVTLNSRRCELQQVDLADERGEVYLQLMLLRDAAPPAAPDNKSSAGPRPEDIPRFTHDLNNIFTVIYASVDLASRPDVANQDLRATLLGAQKAARDGAAIVTRIRQAIGREPVVAPAHAAPASSPSKQGTSERLLVVSSDLGTRLLLRAVLAYRGYEVMEAPDTTVAQQRLGEGAFNLAIVDLEGNSGPWQPIAERIPVLLLGQEPPSSGNSPPWLRKPFENAELAARARAILDESVGRPSVAQE